MTSCLVVFLALAVVHWQTTNSQAYKILVLPQPVKSHIFPMISMAEGLVDRGHEVTIFLSEGMPLDIASINDRQRGSARVMRYKDGNQDFDAVASEFVANSLQNHLSFWDQLATTREV
jgi:hypothetical protein